MGKLTNFYFTNEQLEDAKACSFSIFDNELLKDVIMKDNIVDKWCAVNLNTEQMIEISIHDNLYFEVGHGLAIFNNINILKGTLEQEPHKCHCPDINFSFQGLGCVCGGI